MAAVDANTAAIEAQIAQVSAQMAASTIVAPIAGTVTAIYNEDRQMAILQIVRS